MVWCDRIGNTLRGPEMDRSPTRMEVNAAIERLISGEGDFVEDAALVIEYGHSLPEASVAQITWRRSRNRKPPTSASGYAPGLGNVEIDTAGPRPEPEEIELGVRKERIGHYRLWHGAGDGHLYFQHFWKSGVSTRGISEQSPTYCLGFHPATLEPRFLGLVEIQPLFQLGRFRISYPRMKVLHGTFRGHFFGLHIEHHW
ncbi:MAG: hypothetical protein JWO84_28 [Parcubacteria group bacterium]|nr:hypothetical protein [Parcubacteria group bacterium]